MSVYQLLFAVRRRDTWLSIRNTIQFIVFVSKPPSEGVWERTASAGSLEFQIVKITVKRVVARKMGKETA